MSMPAISILQPWAWLILHAGKDIENRTWHTKFRGRILVHAGKTLPKRDYAEDREYYAESDPPILLPAYDDMPRGGIVGAVDIVDCVREHPSRWKMPDTWGFILANPKACEFIQYRGQLGIFPVDADALHGLTLSRSAPHDL